MQSDMTKKSDIRTPEGYFENLQTRLMGIAGEPAVQKPSFARKLLPYFAYAASLVAIVLVGSAIIRTTAMRESEADWEDNLVAEVLLNGDPYALIFESDTDMNP